MSYRSNPIRSLRRQSATTPFVSGINDFFDSNKLKSGMAVSKSSCRQCRCQHPAPAVLAIPAAPCQVCHRAGQWRWFPLFCADAHVCADAHAPGKQPDQSGAGQGPAPGRFVPCPVPGCSSGRGIAQEFETYERNHNNRIAERITTSMLPCFSRHLLFD